MSQSSSPKYLASTSIEDLADQPDRYQHNWLLTYLDVFVLIIMLMVTLMALSDLKTDKDSKKINNPDKKTTETIHAVKKDQIESIQVSSTQLPDELSAKKPISNPQKTDTNPVVEKIEELQNKTSTPIKQSDKNKLQENLTKAIKDLGLNNAVDMKVTLGYAQLEIQDKILFKSSDANLLEEGKPLLEKLAPLLKQSLGLIFIEGHTDDRPIKTEQFPSNWELGATRATNVLRYLLSQNIDSSRLRAISSAATKPIADNNTEEGREKNRRVSIMIQVADTVN